ncbi:hypothetical protein [Methylobacterium variabile]|jgi:hypothetical protein|nr:hypothetical protein [Methylobacterium variabile]
MARITIALGAVAMAIAGSVALSYVVECARRTRQGQQARPT